MRGFTFSCRRLTAGPLVVILLALASAASMRAQDTAITLSIDDGTASRPIARLLNGTWASAVSCVPRRSSATTPEARERLSVSGGPAPQVVQPVPPAGEDWQRLAPAILQLFDRRERQERLAKTIASAQTAIDFIYRAPSGQTYYFEASRRIASPNDVDADTDPPGTLRIALSGFLRDGGDGPASVGSKSELRWEQDGLAAGPAGPDLAPLGVLQEGARSLWVMKAQSGTTTWYTIHEVTQQGVDTLLTARVPMC